MVWFTLQWVIGSGSPLVFHDPSVPFCMPRLCVVLPACSGGNSIAAAFVATAFFVRSSCSLEVFAMSSASQNLCVAIIAFLFDATLCPAPACRNLRGAIQPGSLRRSRCLPVQGARDHTARVFHCAELTLVRSSLQERAKSVAPFFFLLLVAGATFVFLRTVSIGRLSGAGQNGLLSIRRSMCGCGQRSASFSSGSPAHMARCALRDYSYRRLDVSTAFEPVMLISGRHHRSKRPRNRNRMAGASHASGVRIWNGVDVRLPPSPTIS